MNHYELIISSPSMDDKATMWIAKEKIDDIRNAIKSQGYIKKDIWTYHNSFNGKQMYIDIHPIRASDEDDVIESIKEFENELKEKYKFL